MINCLLIEISKKNYLYISGSAFLDGKYEGRAYSCSLNSDGTGSISFCLINEPIRIDIEHCKFVKSLQDIFIKKEKEVKCTCLSTNFSFNGIGCSCGGK